MLVLERHTVNYKSQEREYLESVAVVVGNTEQLGIGIEGDHRILHGKPEEDSGEARFCFQRSAPRRSPIRAAHLLPSRDQQEGLGNTRSDNTASNPDESTDEVVDCGYAVLSLAACHAVPATYRDRV